MWSTAVHTWTRRDSAVMFDVGASGIRAVQARGPSRQPVVRDALLIASPSGEARANAATPDEIVPRAARMIGQGRFTGRHVGLVLSPPNVHFHTMQLPESLFEQHDDAVREALAWEVSKESRGEAGDFETRYWRLPPGHRQRLNVMAVTMNSAAAASWVRAFRRRDLLLRSIDVSPCALLQLAVRAGQDDPESLWAILDLGHRAAHLAINLGQTPVYIRSLQFSGHELTERIASAFDISVARAEALKRAHGMADAAPAGDGALENPPQLRDAAFRAILSEVVGDAVDSLVAEIDRCFSYVAQNYVNHPLGRIVLAGGGAGLVGLDRRLQAKLGLPVEHLAIETTADGSPSLSSAASLGGSLRDLEDR